MTANVRSITGSCSRLPLGKPAGAWRFTVIVSGTTAPAKVVPALRNIRHSGVTAEIAFDNAGDLQQGLLSVFRVQNGKWVLQ